MQFKKNFSKTVPKNVDILPKLEQFENHLRNCNYQLRNMPNSYYIRTIRKSKSEEIFKFRLDRANRILFKFDASGKNIVYLGYVTHDAQERDARSLNYNHIKLAPHSITRTIKKVHTILDVTPVLNNQIFLAKGTGKTILPLEKLTAGQTLYLTASRLALEIAQSNYPAATADFTSATAALAQVAGISNDQIQSAAATITWLKAQTGFQIVSKKEISEIAAEISEIIKGYSIHHTLFPLHEYKKFPYSKFSHSAKEQVYKLAQAYQDFLDESNLFDANDIAKKVLRLSKVPDYDLIIADEAHKFTKAQIAAISRLSSTKIIWTGDPNQLLYLPFSALFAHNMYCGFSEINYRSIKELSEFVNEVSYLRQSFCERTFYDYTEVGARNGPFPHMVKLKDQKALFASIADKHYFAIVVGSEKIKNTLAKKYNIAIGRLFLVNEIRGLEYENIYCYDIMSSAKADWAKILSGADTNKNRIRHYFNIFYTAITAAKSHLFIYESKEFDFEPFEFCETLRSYNVEFFATKKLSSKEDWEFEAHRLALIETADPSAIAFAQEQALHATSTKENKPDKVLYKQGLDYLVLEKNKPVKKCVQDEDIVSKKVKNGQELYFDLTICTKCVDYDLCIANEADDQKAVRIKDSSIKMVLKEKAKIAESTVAPAAFIEKERTATVSFEEIEAISITGKTAAEYEVHEVYEPEITDIDADESSTTSVASHADDASDDADKSSTTPVASHANDASDDADESSTTTVASHADDASDDADESSTTTGFSC
ncbi:UvrD-helicase domain-containing protein [Candidatus Epulonipiscium viviparus]|uniref:UvrD-helicase domain-containing protein n=1 Tax=Candidatus Epulonipiscium viviparus TaxID=420336 RepID=UPI002B1BDE10|nr:UvrD-helicase domain-containing protein [Candidatus Epulopiscium viviparus]